MSLTDENGRMYHIALKKEDLEGARYAIICGDPARVPKIAEMLDNPKELGCNREYNSWLGELSGKKTVVMSHGIGGSSTAIALEELIKLGVDTFIRVGTSGGMQTDILPGDIVILNGAIRMEGTSKEYLPIEFPAVADFSVTAALKSAADKLGERYQIGIGQCKDSFYGQHSPDTMPISYELKEKWEAWKRGGALVSEMESAALFIIASARKVRAGAVMLCVWNQERVSAGIKDKSDHDTSLAAKTAVEAIKLLAANE